MITRLSWWTKIAVSLRGSQYFFLRECLRHAKENQNIFCWTQVNFWSDETTELCFSVKWFKTSQESLLLFFCLSLFVQDFVGHNKGEHFLLNLWSRDFQQYLLHRKIVLLWGWVSFVLKRIPVNYTNRGELLRFQEKLSPPLNCRCTWTLPGEHISGYVPGLLAYRQERQFEYKCCTKSF